MKLRFVKMEIDAEPIIMSEKKPKNGMIYSVKCDTVRGKAIIGIVPRRDKKL